MRAGQAGESFVTLCHVGAVRQPGIPAWAAVGVS